MLKFPLAALAIGAWLALAAQDPANDPRLLQRAQQLSLPVEQHTLLGRLAGEWDVVVHTTSPGGSAREGRGRVVGAPILGGRYVVLNFVLQQEGAKLEAVQILGFDTLRMLWTSSWRDELSTWSSEASGPVRPDQPQLATLSGTLADARDPTGRPFRLQFDLGSAQRVMVRLFDTYDGKEFEVQRQEWTKR